MSKAVPSDGKVSEYLLKIMRNLSKHKKEDIDKVFSPSILKQCSYGLLIETQLWYMKAYCSVDTFHPEIHEYLVKTANQSSTWRKWEKSKKDDRSSKQKHIDSRTTYRELISAQHGGNKSWFVHDLIVSHVDSLIDTPAMLKELIIMARS